MTMRRVCFSVVGAASLVLALTAACVTDYQKGLGDPNFGAPNALAGQRPPGPSSDNDTPSGAGGGNVAKCVEDGAQLVGDAGACEVSFKTDILGAFSAANCNDTVCHGGSNPQYEPKIDPDDPTGTWNEFAGFTLRTGTLYINPCSTDPAESNIACNVNGDAPCGTLMPLGSTAGLGSTTVERIETWLRCGAPNN
ncbi:MAG TPA: hypothetical protein VM580_13280 [Labilithrix sp.]|nr:hypothetical protein [Labilithrix sp.]